MRAARIDRNQPEIVAALRKVGASVQPLHTVGGGCPDALVGFRGMWRLLEIKDGLKPPSERKLTPDEETWHALAQAPVSVVNSIEQALQAIGAI